MDALKAELQRKRKEKELDFAGSKYARRGEVVDRQLKRLRVEERKELEDKAERQKIDVGVSEIDHTGGEEDTAQPVPELSKQEVVRRLRALGQPATLFGEDDKARAGRLVKAEEEMKVEDEAIGGQQANTLLQLQKEDKASRSVAKVEAALAHERAAGEDTVSEKQDTSQAIVDATYEQFQKAAARLASLRKEEDLPFEDRILGQLKRWCEDWKEDLDVRPTEVAESRSGHLATLMYRENMRHFEALFLRLEKRELDEELVAGLWMVVKAMRERNYLHAYDIYLKLAIGTAPWPIGVTSVGIHERSAREKISHVRNVHGEAHIMNDEATRKYFQGLKRLMTFVQRAYPTEPSRSVDFNSVSDPGRGVAGAGCDKQALIEAETMGVGPKALGLTDAPHFLEKDGSVRVPPRWINILKQSELAKKTWGAS